MVEMLKQLGQLVAAPPSKQQPAQFFKRPRDKEDNTYYFLQIQANAVLDILVFIENKIM